LANVWLNQGTKYKHKIKRILIDNIETNYDSQWQELLNKDDSKLRTYKLFKHNINIENYLVDRINVSTRKEFTKLRVSAHQLRLETGRFTKPKTPVDDRLCHFCNTRSVESEEHFMMACPLSRGQKYFIQAIGYLHSLLCPQL
jgi:hypothetical protein